tara:strand:- start:104 stop:211 length:108 start_codon:yes stop_codon:yes gene_type:complete
MSRTIDPAFDANEKSPDFFSMANKWTDQDLPESIT